MYVCMYVCMHESSRSQEPDQMRRTPVGSGEVELEWLENLVSRIIEVLHHPAILLGSGAPIPDSRVANNPYQPTAILVSSGAQEVRLE